MAITVSDTGGGNFTPAPEGVHRGVCIDVIDKGIVTTEWNGQKREKRKVVIRWAIEAEREDGSAFYVDQWYTASLNEKALLRQHLETWRGKTFTGAELAGFDLEDLLGANCQLVILHNHKGDRTYANVKGITPPGKGTPKMDVPRGYVRMQEREQENGGPQNHQGRPWEEENDDSSDMPF